MAVMDVGRRRTVGITGTDVGLVSQAGRNGMGDYVDTVTGDLVSDSGQVITPGGGSVYSPGAFLTNADYEAYMNPGGVNSSAGGFWSSLTNSLIGAGTKLGTQALATPGTTILPNGTVIAGTPQGTSALTGSGVNVGSSGVLLIAAVGIGLMLMLGGRR